MSLAFLAPAAPRRFAEPEPDVLADAVAREESALRRGFLAARQSMLDVLDTALADPSIPPRVVNDMLRSFETVLTERTQPALEAAFTKGAEHAFDALPSSATLGYTFDLVNPRAVSWAEAGNATGWALLESAEMVTGVSDETRRAINRLIADALRAGPAPPGIAAQIRPLIGLTERDALAVGRLMARLIEDGRTPAQVERLVTRAANRFLRERAITFARTLVIDAANAGQVALWENSVQDGLLIAAEWDKVWLTAKGERTCPQCRPLNGQRTDFPDGTFSVGIGRPPLHVRCRCTVAAVRKQEAA